MTRWLGKIFGCSDPAPSIPPAPPNPSWSVMNDGTLVRMDARHGGSIWSINRTSFEYIPDTDQGGQCQTALQLDNGGEGNNPTEGGSVTDAGGPTSTSVITATRQVSAAELEISTRMAYWEPFQGQKLSGYTLSKRVTVLNDGIIKDEITLESAEDHGTCAIEGLTCYVDMGLNALYSYDPIRHEAIQLPYTNSPVFNPAVMVNSDLPLIVSDGSHAFALYSPGRNYSAWMGAGAGSRNASNKLNAAGQGYAPFPAGKYSWYVYIVVGSLDQVKAGLSTLKATT